MEKIEEAIEVLLRQGAIVVLFPNEEERKELIRKATVISIDNNEQKKEPGQKKTKKTGKPGRGIRGQTSITKAAIERSLRPEVLENFLREAGTNLIEKDGELYVNNAVLARLSPKEFPPKRADSPKA